MKSRADILGVFRASQLHVENLFDRKIKTLQSSDAKKFLPHEFQMELQNRGIVCRVSYPHMPQQNGFAKCKHHHIIDVDLTLLAHAHLPMKLWDLSFEMAVFIINCLPFKSPTVRCISEFIAYLLHLLTLFSVLFIMNLLLRVRVTCITSLGSRFIMIRRG